MVFFGDGSEESVEFQFGESVEYIYIEGIYIVVIDVMGVNGKVISYIQDLIVVFEVFQNLEVIIVFVFGDLFFIDVVVIVELEIFFEVFFGEIFDEELVVFMEGEMIWYIYSVIGEYVVRVVACSGGIGSVEVIDMVIIVNLLLLLIDFEDFIQEYVFFNFGGVIFIVIDNLDMLVVNLSSCVAQLNKMDGLEVWVGFFLELGEFVDFVFV